MPKLSKRLAGLASKIEDRVYEPLEAIALVKSAELHVFSFPDYGIVMSYMPCRVKNGAREPNSHSVVTL